MIEVPLTVDAAARGLRSGSFTSLELAEAMIGRADLLDGQLGSFVTRFDDDARARAERADADFAAGVDRGPYQGIPIGVKDIIAVAEGPTTANSVILDREWGGAP